MPARTETAQVDVGFDRSALVRLWVVTAVAVLGGIGMLLAEYVFLGVEVPPWLRITLGVLAVVMGLWFGYAAFERARSDDPAIRLDGDTVLFHVNPGRRIVLRRDEIRGVGRVRDMTQAPQRAILGDRVFEVATTRAEGLRASSILVGSRFVAEDLAAVRERLAAALGSSRWPGQSVAGHPEELGP
ncbi:MAG: hypothetical protein KY462_04495 [Actinobacteria bacterium]|nr:hypothetical protein [Actinomycetota bacterium]